MIGELINKFDALPEKDANLGTFNTMFKLRIEGDVSDSIEIFGLRVGGFREVFVKGDLKLIDLQFNPKKLNVRVKEYRYFYRVHLKGVLIGTFNTIEGAAQLSNLSRANVSNCMRKDRQSKAGYYFDKYKNPDF